MTVRSARTMVRAEHHEQRRRAERRGRWHGAGHAACPRLAAHLAHLETRRPPCGPLSTRVIAPDLRGIGGSERAAAGYDAANAGTADLLGRDGRPRGRDGMRGRDRRRCRAGVPARARASRPCGRTRAHRGPARSACRARRRFLAARPALVVRLPSGAGTGRDGAGRQRGGLRGFLPHGRHRRRAPGFRRRSARAILDRLRQARRTCAVASRSTGRSPPTPASCSRPRPTRRLSVPTLAVAGGVVGDALHESARRGWPMISAAVTLSGVRAHRAGRPAPQAGRRHHHLARVPDGSAGELSDGPSRRQRLAGR